MLIPRANAKTGQHNQRKAYSPPRPQFVLLQKTREVEVLPNRKPLVLETPHEPLPQQPQVNEDRISLHTLFTPSAMLYRADNAPHLQAHPIAPDQPHVQRNHPPLQM